MDKAAWGLLLIDIKEMRQDIREVKKATSNLKFKVAFFGAVFGYAAAFLKGKFGI